MAAKEPNFAGNCNISNKTNLPSEDQMIA